MKKADLAPYGAAIDPTLLDNQFRMNSQGFFSAHSQKLISQRTDNTGSQRKSTQHVQVIPTVGTRIAKDRMR